LTVQPGFIPSQNNRLRVGLQYIGYFFQAALQPQRPASRRDVSDIGCLLVGH
jgi:hypothetical protein